MKHIAIIGAGLSGLTLAHTLSSKAHVTIFEKSRGLGGRMSTRYASPFAFDHGAPYWTAESKEFLDFLQPFLSSGVVQPWLGAVAFLEKKCAPILKTDRPLRFVATPYGNSLCKALAINQKIHTQCEVRSVIQNNNQWELRDGDDRLLGSFDVILSTLPQPQMFRLFQSHIDEKALLSSVKYESCLTLMLGMPLPWVYEWTQALVNKSPIQSVFVESTKPLRNTQVTSLTVHACPQWSAQHLHNDRSIIQELLLQELLDLLALDRALIDYQQSHRWLYAQSLDITSPYTDYKKGLIAFGDWSCGSQAESVWMQATKIANSILETL